MSIKSNIAMEGRSGSAKQVVLVENYSRIALFWRSIETREERSAMCRPNITIKKFLALSAMVLASASFGLAQHYDVICVGRRPTDTWYDLAVRSDT